MKEALRRRREVEVEDAIGILTQGTEFAVRALLAYVFHGPVFPIAFLLFLFLLLALVALMYWHTNKSPESVAVCRKLIMGSIILRVLFFAADLTMGQVFRQPNSPAVLGGPFGIVFTVFVCPGFTMVCVAYQDELY